MLHSTAHTAFSLCWLRPGSVQLILPWLYHVNLTCYFVVISQAVPYWVDDESVRPSMLLSAPPVRPAAAAAGSSSAAGNGQHVTVEVQEEVSWQQVLEFRVYGLMSDEGLVCLQQHFNPAGACRHVLPASCLWCAAIHNTICSSGSLLRH
jgi:hypothetical protein